MDDAINDRRLGRPGVRQGRQQLKQLIDLQPFQEGFLGGRATTDGEAATMGNGKAAMELMGQWAPGAQKRQQRRQAGHRRQARLVPVPGRRPAAPAPPTDGFGGGDGFAVGKDAPPEAIDFLKFLSSLDAASRTERSTTAPCRRPTAAEASVTDPYLKTVLEQRAKATFAQLYLDQATTPALGAAINDAIQKLYAGTATPEQVAKEIADAAKTQ